MALSNWDTLAVNQNGEPTNGVFTSPLGVGVTIYKNWLYISDEKAWEAGGAYIKPTVMEIMKGSIVYKDTHIFAKRGPQSGIFCIVHVPTWSPGSNNIFTAMVGAGVYGFDGEDWAGVNDDSMRFLIRMLKDDETPHELKNLDLSKALRFNQGDEYFATRLGGDVPATEVGKAEPTIMSKLIENMK